MQVVSIEPFTNRSMKKSVIYPGEDFVVSDSLGAELIKKGLVKPQENFIGDQSRPAQAIGAKLSASPVAQASHPLRLIKRGRGARQTGAYLLPIPAIN